MKGCKYTSGGKENPLTTEIFQYLEDTPTGERQVDVLIDTLLSNGVVESKDEDLIVVGDFGRDAIVDINDTARKFFGAQRDLINLSPLGTGFKISIDQEGYNTMSLLEDPTETVKQSIPEQDQSTPEQEEEEEESQEEEDDYSEAFMTKRRADVATKLLITNLEKQIDRLERLEQTGTTEKRIKQLQLLKENMQKIERGKAKLDDILDFVDYVTEVYDRAQSLMDKIETEYEETYKTASQERRAEMLKDISELKETIDAFYSKDKSKSVLNLIQLKISKDMQDGEAKENLVTELSFAIQEMDSIDERYLELAIPIQADYLMSFAPIEVNEQIDAKIKKIRDTGQLSGLNRLDKRYLNLTFSNIKNKIARLFNTEQSINYRKQLIELNIQQLQENKLGREGIIRDLRETHKDASLFSMYADPLVYSNDASIQLFALAVKDKLVQANNATIDTKYRLRDAYKKFVEFKGVGEDNVAKLYEDMIEEVVIYKKDSSGNYVPFRMLSFVQQYDISKYNKAKNDFMTKLRETYNFPTDPSKYDDFFKSKNGKEYSKAMAAWYNENSEPIDGAYKIIADLERAAKNAGKNWAIAKNAKDEEAMKGWGRELGRLRFELDRVSREFDGTRSPIGVLTKPKLSKYSNPKFKAMPKAVKEYYDLVTQIYAEDQKKIGKSGLYRNSWEDMSYILPSVRKSGYDKMQEDGFKNSATDLLQDGFTAQETDTEFGELVKANGERVMAVPRYFTNPVTASLVSKDITNSIIKFNDMSNRYKYKGEISGVVNIMRAAIGNREVSTLTATGDVVLDQTAKKLGFNLVAPKDATQTNTYKQLDAFIKSVYYGQSMEEDMFNSKISSNKAVSFVTGLTAVSTLGFNVLQAGNQLIIDSSMSAQEGWSNQFYSREDLFWARQKMYLSGDNIATMFLESANKKFTEKHKILQMMEKFDGLQQFDEKFGKEAGSAVKKNIKLNSLFFMQSAAELKTTAERMLALSRSYKGKLKDSNGKVLLNENGEEMDLWDALIEDKTGKLIVDPRVKNFDESKFVSLLHGISKRSNQLKGGFDRTMMERSHAGRLVLVFRKYFVPAYRKRFGLNGGGAALDSELGSLMEGYYSTTANTISNAAHELFRNKDLSKAVKILLGKNATADEKANLKRFIYEQAVLTLIATVSLLTQSLFDDDDEDWATGMIGYQLLRLDTELRAFRSPKEFGRMVMSPTATARPIQNTYEAIAAMWNAAVYNTTGLGDPEDIYYQRKSGMFDKGDSKWVKEFLDALPLASGVFKSTDPTQAKKYYDQFS